MRGHYCRWGEQCPALRAFYSAIRRRVRVYDNPETFDRYSVVIARTEKGRKMVDIYGMSANALAPNGFNQFSHTLDARNFSWTHNRVRWQSLPEDVLKAIAMRLWPTSQNSH